MCPVCGYDRLRRPPRNFIICPSCGTEFSYSDSAVSHQELRREWLLHGGKWQSNVMRQPIGWDRDRQLQNLDRVQNSATTPTFSTHIETAATITTPMRVEARGELISAPSMLGFHVLK
jgi:hypothetical protein